MTSQPCCHFTFMRAVVVLWVLFAGVLDMQLKRAIYLPADVALSSQAALALHQQLLAHLTRTLMAVLVPPTNHNTTLATYAIHSVRFTSHFDFSFFFSPVVSLSLSLCVCMCVCVCVCVCVVHRLPDTSLCRPKKIYHLPAMLSPRVQLLRVTIELAIRYCIHSLHANVLSAASLRLSPFVFITLLLLLFFVFGCRC
jgi:hypothetical protein